MPLFTELLQGLADVFTLEVLLAILAGVAISQFCLLYTSDAADE